MPFRIFDAEGKVTVDDSGVDRGLTRIRNKVRETVARVDSMEGTAQLKADASQLDKEIDRARQKLRSVDRQRATASADMDLTQFDVAEAKLRTKIKALEREKIEIDVRMGRDLKVMDRTLVGLIQRLRGVGRVTPWQDVQKLGNALHNARITLGPLSLSLRGLIVAMLTLAPLVTAAAGAVGGLVAVLGQGLIGAAGFGGAALLGFGALLGGVVGAVIAHRDQFNKFGHALRMVGEEFKRQTRIPTSFFDAIRSGIESLRRDMPLFTRATNTALDTIGTHMERFFDSLRSDRFRGVLRRLFGNANEALGPLIDGLAALTRTAVNIGASFSRYLAPATRAFRDWSAGAENATRNANSLDGTVDELMSSLRAVGRFLGSVTRLVVDFFMAGGPAGRRMLDDITDLVNKWSEWLETKEGQRAVTQFLDDSWDTVKKVAKVLEDIFQLIDNLASAGKPVLDWMLGAVDAALDLFNNLEDSTGAGDELVTALAGLIILRKAVGWAAALAGLLGGGIVLKGLKGLGKGLLLRLLFPTGEAGAGVGAAIRTALIGGFRVAIPAAVGYAVGTIANAYRTKFREAFDAAGVPSVVKEVFTKLFDFTPVGQVGRLVEAINHPIETIKNAWKNLKTFVGTGIKFAFILPNPIGAVRSIINRVKRLVDNPLDFVFNIPNPISSARNIWNRVKGLISDTIGFKFSLPNPLGAVRAIWNRVKSTISSAIRFVFNLPNPLSQARSIWNRVKGVISDAISFVLNLPDVVGKAQAIWDSVQGIMSQGITLPINVIANLSGIPGKLLGKLGLAGGGLALGLAAGGQALNTPGDPVTRAQAARALQNGRTSPMGGKVIEPRMINNFQIVGEQNGSPEFVIPTNPAYRGRARRLLAEAVSVIGSGFARGAAAAGRKKRPPRRRKVYSGSHYLAPVQALENEIATKDNALTQLDRAYNTDARFKPLVDDDGQRIEDNIDWHVKQLDELAGRAAHLATLERNLADAIEQAHSKLRNAMETWAKRRPDATIIKGSGKNKKRVDNPQFKTWAAKMNDLRDAYGEVPLSDAQGARFRADDYDSDAYSYRADIKETRGTVSAPLSSGGMDAFLRQTGMFETLQGLNLAVAQAAATLDNPADDRAAASSLAGFWESVVNRIGPGGDKELLTEAYNNLAGARQGAADTGGAPDIGTQISTFNQARDDLFREFGSNYSPGGGIVGAIAGGVSRGVISGLSSSGIGPSSFGGGGGSAAPAGKSVTFQQTNHYAAPPPDPHTFVKSMAWEAQAL